MSLVATLLTLAFTLLALMHLYWAAGGRWGIQHAVPSQGGKPLFTPDSWVTLLVACALAVIALLAALFLLPAPSHLLHALAQGGAQFTGAVLLLRGVGDFRYVGLFKRVKESSFARFDTWLYSPFCLASGGGFLWLGIA